MFDIIPYYKPLGSTPLQAIQKLKVERAELADTPITFAGRLDPMAEGLLLLLCGEAVHRKQEFLDLPKTYEAKILLGFNSDTFDILGLATRGNIQPQNPHDLVTAVKSLEGTHNFPYPPYSSKTIDGKPLWELTRENKVTELPTREMTVFSTDKIEVTTQPWQKIHSYIRNSISLVTGDFRQTDILNNWQTLSHDLDPAQGLHIIFVVFTVTSGTYIRTLTNQLGKHLNTGALLLHLKRTAVGDYKI